MFDLRTTILAELNTFTVDGITAYKDLENSTLCVEDTEKIVFSSGACAIGDWRIDAREPFLFSQNKVFNTVELFVYSKSQTSINNIDSYADSLANLLDNNKFSRADVMSTHVISVGETQKAKPGLYYKILTLEILALEDPGNRECPVPGVLTMSNYDSLDDIDSLHTTTVTLSAGSVFTPARYLWIFDFTGSLTPQTEVFIRETAVPQITWTPDDYLGGGDVFTLECIALDSTNSRYISTGVKTAYTA